MYLYPQGYVSSLTRVPFDASTDEGRNALGVVSVTDCIAHSRLAGADAQPDVIRGMIAAATDLGENKTGKAFVRSRWLYTSNRWPSYGRLDLGIGPIIAIESVNTYDSDGLAHLVDALEYRLTDRLLILKQSAPAFPLGFDDDVVQVVFTAGYSAKPELIPEPIRLWVKMVVSALYEQREAWISGKQSLEYPRHIDGLLDAYRSPQGMV